MSPADGTRRAHGPVEDTHWDVIVVGSGFGGSVAALRLVEKGYRVLVLEAGRRFADHELPRSSWDLRRFLWAPRLGWLGIQRVHVLRNVVVLAGAGVGGGSLVYANTLYRPPAEFYDDPQWADLADWRAGARAALRHRRTDARRGDQPDHHRRGPRDAAGRQADGARTPSVRPRSGISRPRRARRGPACATYRTRSSAGQRRLAPGSPECGACMTGCRANAKNTLVKDYVYLAMGGRAGSTGHRPPTSRITSPRRRKVAAGGWTSCAPVRGGAGAHPAHVHRRPGGARGGRVRHPAAAAPDAGRRRAAGPVASGSARADPHQLRGADRRDGGHRASRRDADYTARRGDHLVVPPRRRTRTSSRCATATGQQRDGAALHARCLADGGARAAVADLARPAGAPPGSAAAILLRIRHWSERVDHRAWSCSPWTTR